jgi:hypothetical protein
MRNRPAVEASLEVRASIDAVLNSFGIGALRLAGSAGVRVIHLRPFESYRDRSPALRRLASGVDEWPVPPAGLFVVEERAVYLRSTSPMTVAHEFAHALDCALGGGIYLSSVDPRIRRAYRSARSFVTPYAASAIDEYFAECLRAWVEVNDLGSPWPRATRARLREIDPAMSTVLESLFAYDLVA